MAHGVSGRQREEEERGERGRRRANHSKWRRQAKSFGACYAMDLDGGVELPPQQDAQDPRNGRGLLMRNERANLQEREWHNTAGGTAFTRNEAGCYMLHSYELSPSCTMRSLPSLFWPT